MNDKQLFRCLRFVEMIYERLVEGRLIANHIDGKIDVTSTVTLISEVEAMRADLKFGGGKDSYQGWSSHATWLIALYVDNDYSLHQQALGLARENTDAGLLAQKLRLCFSTVVDQPQDVNWQEFAEHYLTKVKEGC